MASRRSERTLEASRERFQRRIERVRAGIDREIGVAAPDPASMTVPLLAFAGGAAMMAGLLRRFRRRQRTSEARRS